MNPVLILALECLKLSLELTLEIVKSQPIEFRQKAWERHFKIVDALDKFFGLDKILNADDPDKPERPK